MNEALVDRIDAFLPQTQCTRCGYDDCRAYARALAAGETGINRCPPGGDETIRWLASLTGTEPLPLDPACGRHSQRQIARVNESWCIGCRLCIDACPVDAIVGAAKRMHTVIESECTGCELCIEPCPVDCIHMVAPRGGPRSVKAWLETRADHCRRRYRARRRRLDARRGAGAARRRRHKRPTLAERQSDIEAAIARVRRRRAARFPGNAG